MSEESNVLEAVEVAAKTGKIRKGSNEVTKVIEKGKAKLVVIAKDVNPPEITMHIPMIAKEKGIKCVEVGSKDDLGASAGISIGTTAIAIVEEGEAKKLIQQLTKEKA
jgi:large subunit ribosomal protein L7Ae